MSYHARLGKGLVITAAVTLFVLSFPVVTFWATNEYANGEAPTSTFVPGPYPKADAIVILGGGRRQFAVEYGVPETADYGTLTRLRYGARLYKQYHYPVLVSGGRPPLGVSRGVLAEGDIMKGILEEEYGVPVRWVESQADDTLGNARFSAPLLRSAGVQTILLVTDANHTPRARAAFEQQGLKVIETPTLFEPPRTMNPSDFKPSIHGLMLSRQAIYNVLNRLRTWLFS